MSKLSHGPRTAPYLFENDGHGRMRNVAPQPVTIYGPRTWGASGGRGPSTETFAGSRCRSYPGTAAMLRNETVAGNAISVRLVGLSSPRSAVGAEVTVSVGERRWEGAVHGGKLFVHQ